jgi:hypothetical protein
MTWTPLRSRHAAQSPRGRAVQQPGRTHARTDARGPHPRGARPTRCPSPGRGPREFRPGGRPRTDGKAADLPPLPLQCLVARWASQARDPRAGARAARRLAGCANDDGGMRPPVREPAVPLRSAKQCAATGQQSNRVDRNDPSRARAPGAERARPAFPPEQIRVPILSAVARRIYCRFEPQRRPNRGKPTQRWCCACFLPTRRRSPAAGRKIPGG